MNKVTKKWFAFIYCIENIQGEINIVPHLIIVLIFANLELLCYKHDEFNGGNKKIPKIKMHKPNTNPFINSLPGLSIR